MLVSVDGRHHNHKQNHNGPVIMTGVLFNFLLHDQGSTYPNRLPNKLIKNVSNADGTI
jgi:hypothetical protein